MNKNKISFNGFKPLMLAVHTAETKLIDKLKRHRGKHMHLTPAEYVQEWVAFGLSIPKANGMVYSKKWLEDIARDAGIKQREAGGGRKPASPAEKQAKAFTKWLASMPPTLTSAQRKAVVSKVAKA